MTNKRSVSNQIILTIASHLTCVTPFMSMGFSAVSLSTLQSADHPNPLTPSQASWFASIASLSIPIGCFLSGPIADKFGRRAIFLTINAVCIIGWLIISGSYFMEHQQYVVLMIGRFITGVATGLSSMPGTIYVAEISSVQMRAFLTTVIAITVAIGICYVYVLGYIFVGNWGLVALIAVVLPCIGIFLTIFYLPESPTWLVGKYRIEDARRNMCKIFGNKEYTPEIEDEIDILIRARNHHEETASSISKLEYIKQPICYKPFIAIVGYFFFQQFSGVYVTVYYANDVVKESGIQIDNYFAILLIGVTRLISAILVTYVSKIYGRRALSIFSGLSMAVCMFGLAIYVYLLSGHKIEIDIENTLKYLPLTLLLIYFFVGSIGFTTLPFAMAPEMFQDSIRGTASGLSSCIAYIFSFAIIKIYPNMIALMKSYGVFTFYGVMALIGTLFIIYYLPETKDRSFQDIQNFYENKKEEKKHIDEDEQFIP